MSLEEENRRLRARIAELENKIPKEPVPLQPTDITHSFYKVERLSNEEIHRFGRQLVTPRFGYEFGAGGLGAPAALYLGAAGIGRLGIVDHDTVDTNNLHRQVIHTEDRKGVNKAVSAAMTIKAIYSKVDVIPYAYNLDRTNALQLIGQYDIILDCTDNISTRYLLSDAAVLLGKPVISGSALMTDGQLTVYNYNNGPCYRCLHPTPPPAAAVGKCVDNGVLGVAMDEPSFLIFSGMGNPMFRTMKLRHKKKDCAVCGENPTIRELVDYVQFCGSGADDKTVSENLLKPDERVHVEQYSTLVNKGVPHILVDVRPKIQYDICRLPNSMHIPIDDLEKRMAEVKETMKKKNIESNNGK
ncbi:hypothetical protein BDB01DRAFT_719634 [Pilobolus umbonatus]|nr:hypothetical protein BDB01DRAFT_719634 [Pilobolus umbonatus]